MTQILAINPGSTSTKIAVFENNKQVFIKNIKHSAEELAPFKKITDQVDFRKEIILTHYVRMKLKLRPFSSLSVVVD